LQIVFWHLFMWNSFEWLNQKREWMFPKLKFEYKITFAYLVIGGAWIVFSDELLERLIANLHTLTDIQTYKGWFYVAFTAILLFFFLKKHLSKLRSAQRKAEESDQLKTAFLHNITHEIRTPMNSIIGFSELLNNPELDFERAQNYTEIIAQSSDSLLSIITDIVDISTIESGQAKISEKETNLNKLLKQIYDLFILKVQNKNFSFTYKRSLSDDDANIKIDQAKLLAILTNLIGNAMKFTQKGHVIFGYTKKEGMLEFYVEDTGIGIPSGMHDEIFKRFRQVELTDDRQFGGSGLGLAISKAYIEMLGGKIWLTSILGKGSVFYFTIPYNRVEVVGVVEEQNQLENKLIVKKSTTIIIAEDEDLNFKLLDELLSDSKLTILRAVNGLEALELCKSNQHVDLVLMDIKMPIMNGYEATERILAIRPTLPIIAQTAYSSDADISRAFTCGCSDFISKPISRELLISKINKQLNA